MAHPGTPASAGAEHSAPAARRLSAVGSQPAEPRGERASTPKPGRGRPGYDRDTLVARAIEVFMRRGYNGTSMDVLARELGITKSAIYHHVGSKEELLRSALSVGLGELDAALTRQEQRRGVSAGERLRGAVRSAVEVLIAHQASVTLLLRVHGNSEVEREALEQRRQIDRRLTALVRQAQAEGSVRSDLDAHVAARLLFGTVNSLTEWYRADSAIAAGEIAHALTTMAFDGLSVR
ncbi:TetR family transcriptional regulator [Brevibacterium sp. 5221]|uniref:TetR family transcriptional regulator n=1 Tax=Brevibacterium rongguiense TaxID=2695267 RepID=A0A6N9H827_9MICO|nr:TetR/AcrR family transcriptional regulator [Brevibacterium rongguiense]MYM19732.1 TetR family transcriptional regulator [Brevibacterium rongguiense]